MTDSDGANGDDTHATSSRRTVIAAAGGIGASLAAGCLGGDSGGGGDSGDDGEGGMDDGTMEGDGTTEDEGGMDDGTDSTEDGSMKPDSWRSVQLSTVRGDETFTVDGFDKPVVLQSFAVWCPKCERQSKELKNMDDPAVVVGLNTDPNEDEAKVRQHAEDNGFDWRFAVAPTEMTDLLIDEFGPTVTNAPSTPVIVACQDGPATMMAGRGINSISDIQDAMDDC